MKITAELLEKAILFAAKCHRGQRRKGDGRPYILHPMSVLRTLYDVKESKNMYLLAIVVMLHDVVEDCGISLKTIAKKFGHQVAALVEELTLLKENYETIGKTKYLCQEVLRMTSYALCIKLCDRLDNVSPREIKKMPEDFKKKYRAETWEIVKTLEERRKLTKTHKAVLKLIKKEIK